LLEKYKESSLGRKIIGWIIFKLIFKFGWEEVKLIGLSQDGDNLWNFVNPLMNNLVPQNGGKLFDYMRK